MNIMKTCCCYERLICVKSHVLECKIVCVGRPMLWSLSFPRASLFHTNLSDHHCCMIFIRYCPTWRDTPFVILTIRSWHLWSTYWTQRRSAYERVDRVPACSF